MQVIKPALLVYVFAERENLPPDGLDYLKRLWEACAQLGMVAPLQKVHSNTEFPSDFGAPSPEFQPLAARINPKSEPPSAYYQAFLFGYYDVVGLIICLGPNIGDDTLERWNLLYKKWLDAAGQCNLPEGILGEAYLFLAQVSALPEALPTMGEIVGNSLPTELSEPTASLTELGFYFWEGVPLEGRRVFALLAPETEEAALTAWTLWYTRDQLAPFVRCLIHAAKIRYEGQVYMRERTKVYEKAESLRKLVEEVNQEIGCQQPTPQQLGKALEQRKVVAAEQNQLHELMGRARSLQNTVRIARINLQQCMQWMYFIGETPHLFDKDLYDAQYIENMVDYDFVYWTEDFNNAQQFQDYAQQHLDYARYLVEEQENRLQQQRNKLQRQENELNLKQAALLTGVLALLAAIEAFQPSGLPVEPLRWPLALLIGAAGVALPLLTLHWKRPYDRLDYAAGMLLVATVVLFTVSWCSYILGQPLPHEGAMIAFIVGLALGFPLIKKLDALQQQHDDLLTAVWSRIRFSKPSKTPLEGSQPDSEPSGHCLKPSNSNLEDSH